MHGRSRMTVDPRIPTMPGWSTRGGEGNVAAAFPKVAVTQANESNAVAATVKVGLPCPVTQANESNAVAATVKVGLPCPSLSPGTSKQS